MCLPLAACKRPMDSFTEILEVWDWVVDDRAVLAVLFEPTFPGPDCPAWALGSSDDECSPDPTSLEYVQGMWEHTDLMGLLDQADRRDHLLTLMFSPQWMVYLSNPDCPAPAAKSWGDVTYQGNEVSSCADLLAAIVEAGHEVALYHPGAIAITWDGYTNLDLSDPDSPVSWTPKQIEDYQGDMTAALGTWPDSIDPPAAVAMGPFESSTLVANWDWPGSAQRSTWVGTQSGWEVPSDGGEATYTSGVLSIPECVDVGTDQTVSIAQASFRHMNNADAIMEVVGLLEKPDAVVPDPLGLVGHPVTYSELYGTDLSAYVLGTYITYHEFGENPEFSHAILGALSDLLVSTRGATVVMDEVLETPCE